MFLKFHSDSKIIEGVIIQYTVYIYIYIYTYVIVNFFCATVLYIYIYIYIHTECSILLRDHSLVFI